MIWVKDGVFIDRGPAPEGLTLRIDANLISELRSLHGGDVTLDGRYHCEVWGWQPYERVKSKPAILRFKGEAKLEVYITAQIYVMCKPELLVLVKKS